ncbi:MAG: mechanosensitive ion channel family protein [Myxococcota bacterium]
MDWEIDWGSLGLSGLIEHPLAAEAAGLAAVAFAAWLSLVVIRQILVSGIRRFVARSDSKWDDRLVDARVFMRVAMIAPALVARSGVQMVPGISDATVELVSRLTSAAIVLLVALSFSAILNATNEIYSGLEKYRNRPIKGYIQLLKMVIGGIAFVVFVATLVDKSPLIFLSGLGAMTAVLLLVFKDTILSLVASVQLTSNDMIRVGDWIEMPEFNADGDVVDIALHTISIQNWDKTITTIPTHKFIEGSFKNWRAMGESGGRRIKRSLFLDMNSIRFLTPDEIDRFGQFALLGDYIARKRDDVATFNSEGGRDPNLNADIRRLTNVGTFRAYVVEYLRHHPAIHQGMTLIVRQLDPTVTGLPIEIYCFTNITDWSIYEGIQSDIIDHLLSVAGDFDLRAFQNLSGADVVRIAAAGS